MNTQPTPIWQTPQTTYRRHDSGAFLDYSPAQYAGMSNRAKAKLDADREKRSEQNRARYDQYTRLVVAAYESGEFRYDDKDVHEDARQALYRYQMDTRWEIYKPKVDVLWKRRAPLEEINIGDRLYDFMSKSYAVVEKKFKKSVRVNAEKYGLRTIEAWQLHKASYADARVIVRAELLASATDEEDKQWWLRLYEKIGDNDTWK